MEIVAGTQTDYSPESTICSLSKTLSKRSTFTNQLQLLLFNHTFKSKEQVMAQIKITLSQIENDLEAGLVKFNSEDVGYGSIQKKYGMTDKEARIFFNHPLLKSLQAAEMKFLLVDDSTNVELDEIAPNEQDNPTIVNKGTKRQSKAIDDVDISSHNADMPDFEPVQPELETKQLLEDEISENQSLYVPPTAEKPSDNGSIQDDIEGFELL